MSLYSVWGAQQTGSLHIFAISAQWSSSDQFHINNKPDVDFVRLTLTHWTFLDIQVVYIKSIKSPKGIQNNPEFTPRTIAERRARKDVLHTSA